MSNALFVLTLSVMVSLMLWWGFRTLPREKWQILAAVPERKEEEDVWSGFNLTYYGLFNANACAIAVSILLILLGSLSVPTFGALTIVATMLGVCVPASKIIAKVVEKKPQTRTIGGASFLGIIIAPWVAWLIDATLGSWLGFHTPVVTVLAALFISYAFGEGIGRLACISFGCCYGKPLSQSHPLLQKIFQKQHFVFSGATKKISYAHGLDGEKVLPIQAITAVVYCCAGLAGTYLFLKGYFLAAFMVTLVTTQLWRPFSEFFRADYRGETKISAYQVMGVVSIIYSLFVAFLFPLPATQTLNVMTGLQSLWDPAIIIFLQCVWVMVFLFTGRSRVTGAMMLFHVVKDRI